MRKGSVTPLGGVVPHGGRARKAHALRPREPGAGVSRTAAPRVSTMRVRERTVQPNGYIHENGPPSGDESPGRPRHGSCPGAGEARVLAGSEIRAATAGCGGLGT